MTVSHIFDQPGNTVESVAEKTGVDYSTAYRWKRGAEPRAGHLARLLAADLISADEIRTAGEAALPVPEVA